MFVYKLGVVSFQNGQVPFMTVYVDNNSLTMVATTTISYMKKIMILSYISFYGSLT